MSEQQQAQEGFIVIRMPELVEKVKLSPSTIFAEIAKGRFPAPIKLSARAVAWVSTEIDDYLLRKMQERDARIAAQDARKMRVSKRRARAA